METPASVLFLSNNFPPEVNALANRTSEHARAWVEQGGRVEIIAGPPHFPEGRVYEGYKNELLRETSDGVSILRVPIYIAANEGFVRRTLSYVSYMASAAWYSTRSAERPGVVVASTPQFFAGLAGWLVSRRLRVPFVLEVRDLWPESIVDVGAIHRGVIVRMFEWLETRLYRSADHVVVVSPAFRAHIEERGVAPARISVVPNGVDLDGFGRPVEPAALDALRAELGLGAEFIASYIGTVGLAHGVEVILEAAYRCPDPDIVFLVVGAGARWEAVRDEATDRGLTNVRVVEKQPRERIGAFYALSDVSLVHLCDRPAFRKVIPSKMFESMATRRPIVLGVRGQAEEILQDAGAGLAVPPEDPDALLAAVRTLKADDALRERLGRAGEDFVGQHYDRREIARRSWDLLQRVAGSAAERAPS
jgi:glycosyltransferase involved in cell wall biosynthesis